MSVSFTNLLTPTNNPFNSRILEDATLYKTVAMANNGVVNTSHIDLAAATPYPVTETLNVYINTGADTVATANTNGWVYLQHTSANAVAGDGTPNASAWTNIPTLGHSLHVIAKNATAAQNFTYKLPPGCLQFIRAQYNNDGPAGSNTSGANISLRLLF